MEFRDGLMFFAALFLVSLFVGLVKFSWFLIKWSFKKVFERKKRRIQFYETQWIRARRELREWLKENDSDTHMEREEIRLRHIELAAYMNYLAACGKDDRKGIRCLSKQIKDWQPN